MNLYINHKRNILMLFHRGSFKNTIFVYSQSFATLKQFLIRLDHKSLDITNLFPLFWIKGGQNLLAEHVRLRTLFHR